MKTLVAGLLTLGMTLSLIGDAKAQDKKAPTSRPATAPVEKAPAQQEKNQQTEKEALAAWIKTLCRQADQPHDKIFASAVAGLVAVGKPALPAMKKLQASLKGDRKQALDRAVRRIERGGESRRRRSSDPKDIAAELSKEMKLDAGKSKKLEKVLVEASARRTEVFQQMRDGEMTREEMRDEMQDMQEDLKDQLGKFLTPEQVQKATRRGRGGFGGRRGNRGGGNRDV